QGGHRYQQLLPAARRPHSRARQRVDHHGGAAAGASADVESRQSVQPHLRRAADHRRPACGHARPPRAGHCRRRCRRQGHCRAPPRRVRIRRRRCRTAERRMADPARHPRLRAAPQRRRAAKRSRRGQAIRGDVARRSPRMTVSYENSKVIFQGIKAAGITSLSALPETWLGLLLQQADKDPDVTLIQVAKEEEAIGVAAGAYFAGERHVLLMQNHGFLAAINGIVSLAQLYGIPLCMLIALRGHWGEPYQWHTRGGIVTEGVLRALGIPFEYAGDPVEVGRQIREASTFSQSALAPVALLLTRDLMEEPF